MAEGQRADDQARHDLVADAEIDGRVEHIVRKPNRRCHRDHVAGKQRQLHARLSLRDAVAHGGHAAGHLGDTAGLARGILDQLRIGFERLMRREHVVVGGDDAEVRHLVFAQRDLLGWRADGEAMREVAAGKHGAVCAAAGCLVDAIQIELAAGLRPFADAVCDGLDFGPGGHDVLPSQYISPPPPPSAVPLPR